MAAAVWTGKDASVTRSEDGDCTATPIRASIERGDAYGATLDVGLIDGGPTLPGVKVAVAHLGPSGSPVRIDFLDAAGAKVDSVALR